MQGTGVSQATSSSGSSSSGSESSSSSESLKFDDGLDDELVGDEEDRVKLAQMTEAEREQEMYNRWVCVCMCACVCADNISCKSAPGQNVCLIWHWLQ